MSASTRKSIAVGATVLALLISLILLARLDGSHSKIGDIFHDFEQTHSHNVTEAITKLEGEDRYTLHPADHVYRDPATLEFIWRITAAEARPDGVLKRIYMVNGAFPGPTIEARSGDRIVVEIDNGLLDESLAIHWHGLSMRGFNIMDGAAGLTQAAIRPGERFIYDFVIDEDQHGTFWYHAHDGIQRADGLYGGLVVHKPSSLVFEDDGRILPESLLLIGDWYHRPAADALAFYMHPGAFGMETVPDGMLLNGHGVFECSDAVSARPIDCVQSSRDDLIPLSLDLQKGHILRVVNVGAYAGFNLSLPGLLLEPLAVDGGNEVESGVFRNAGVLHPGERLDLLVRGEHKSSPTEDHAALVVQLDDGAFKYENSALHPLQKFPVRSAGSKNAANAKYSTVQDSYDIQAARSLHVHGDEIPVAADLTLVLYAITQKLAHLENEPHGFINGTTWTSTDQASLNAVPHSDWNQKEHFVPNIPYKASAPVWVDIVLNNLDEESHPFHMHGHSFFVLSTYTSSFNWGSYNPFEDNAPPGGPYDLTRAVRKDTVLVPRRGYAVLRFRADNPGLWAFHCHVLWHMASGMAMAMDVS